MGLFGSEKPKANARGASKTGHDRLATEEARYIAYIRKHDPAEYRRVMRGRLGIASDEGSADPLDSWLSMTSRLKKAGVIDDLDKVGKESMLGRLGEIAAGFVGAMGASQAAQVGAAPRVMIEQPALPMAATPPPAAVAQPTEAQQLGMIEQMRMRVMCEFAMRELQAIPDPEQAALWLLAQAQKYPQIAPLLHELRYTADDHIPSTLANWAKQLPPFEPLMKWLGDQKSWTLAVVQALRKVPATP